jgi:uncharacterized protein YegP (UPF0339 family)
MSGKFEISTTSSGKFMFNLKADNGQVVLTSQMYEAKASAFQGIESVRVNGVQDERFDRLMSTKDEPYFNLKAANGLVIGRSQMYSSTAAMENGVASVMTNAPGAVIADLTAA